MSFEAYLFVCRQKKLPPDFPLLLRAFLRLHALHHAIFENPRVRAFLPLLLAKQLAAVLAGDSSTLPAILQDHLTDPAALFAATFLAGKDGFGEREEASSRFLFLQQLSRHYAGDSRGSRHTLLGNIFIFRGMLKQCRDAMQMKLLLHSFAHSLTDSAVILETLNSPRNSILRRALFFAVYFPAFDSLVDALHGEIDNSVRKHVFLLDNNSPAGNESVDAHSEHAISLALSLLKLPPFRLLDVVVDVSPRGDTDL